MYLILHFSEFHLLILSLMPSLDFFYAALQSALTFPVLKNAVFPVKAAHFGSPGIHWSTQIPPQRPLFLLMACLWDELPFVSTFISMRSPHPKERFWNRNCPQTPPQWTKKQKSLTGWSGLLLAWFGFIPKSSTLVFLTDFLFPYISGEWGLCFVLSHKFFPVFLIFMLLCLIYP